MPVFDAASVLISGIMVSWNVLLFVLKTTLIAGLVLIVTAPGAWIGNFLLSIIAVFVRIIADFIVKIQLIILDHILSAIVGVIRMFPYIVVSDVAVMISGSFTAIALSLITGFFIYQATKNAFSYLGFEGEPTLNTVIVYILVIVLLLFLNPVVSTLLQMTYDLSMIFINTLGDFGSTISGAFPSLLSWGGVSSNNLVAIAVNILIVIILARIIRTTLDLAFTIVQRMIVISIMIIMGPIAISFGVLKSMRSVMVTWFKAMFISNFVFVMYSVMFFFVANSATSILSQISGSGGYDNLIKLLVLAGLIMSISKVEDVVVNIFMSQPTVGFSGTSLGVGAPSGGALNPYTNITQTDNTRSTMRNHLRSRFSNNTNNKK